ncbi:MAG: hypothetical protein KDA93_05975 [Planctomycetaceae bacterium]|nr:hypothetical protein [Planctomycetaceae bacterium]
MRTLISIPLLGLHALCSLLGHGGLHAVQDLGGCHHHAHATPVAEEPGCSHHHCGQSHSHGGATHSHPTDEKPGHSHHDPLHHHDDENCVVCQWHAQVKISITAPSPAVEELPGFDQISFTDTLQTNDVVLAVRSRGPPA